MRSIDSVGTSVAEVSMFHPDGPSLFELARQALSSTERGYDLLAPKFDHTPFRTPDELLQPIAEWIGPFDRGVDLCCGTGAAMRALRPGAREGVTGVDSSQGMLAMAAQYLEESPGESPVQLVHHDVLTWNGEGRFDLAVSFGAFGHILRADEARFVEAVFRALAPGGRFVFVTGTNPGPMHPVWWAAHGFNAAIRLRNVVVRPPFHMYYLTFLWPDIRGVLEAVGFEVRAHEGALDSPFDKAIIVEAKKPGGTATPTGA